MEKHKVINEIEAKESTKGRATQFASESFFNPENFATITQEGIHTFDKLRNFEPKVPKRRISTSLKLDADLKHRLDDWLGLSRQRSDFINYAIRAAFDIIDNNLPEDLD
ncbi:hypothetical protein [Psychrobacillus sp. FSL K6-1464]